MNIKSEIKYYLAYYPEEEDRLNCLLKQSACSLEMDLRQTLPGHITGSAILIEREKMLMIFHPFLKKWLQPGGHLEKGESPFEAAARELTEETGVSATQHLWHKEQTMPFDIDIHLIPANEKKKSLLIFITISVICFLLDTAVPLLENPELPFCWQELNNVEEPNLKKFIKKMERLGV